MCGKEGGWGEEKEAGRVGSFDKWMSGDEAKISRSMKGERGKREEH